MARSNGSKASDSPRVRRTSGSEEPIAVIGIGCRFPGGANDAGTYWSLLAEGKDAITEIPADRWNIDAFYDPDPSIPDKMHTRWGGFLDHVDLFDAHFFGISPREAIHIDPQQRLLLEIALEALEDGGQVPEKLAGSSVGVFVGISTHDYSDLQVIDPLRDPNKDILAGLYGGTGGVLSIAANRISYSFNFQGPSVAVDTACSSALVATHLAARSIWNGECDMALAGGVNCVLSPTINVAFCKAGMLSPDGRSKAFDARANGYVRGEGAGMVVLKPLSKALADADPIYALLRGGGVNQDGRTQGLTVPSRDAQEALLRKTYKEAGIQPRQVRYVEAHGTGTSVGDPIEAGAIGAVLGKGHDGRSPLLVGSVKTNIGHLEAASGAAGLIKAVLTLANRAVPPSLHFEEPNPKIPFSELHLRVPTALEPLPDGDSPAVVGVNSFGFGGTNAHIILEEAPAGSPARSAQPTPQRRAYLVPLSARNEEGLLATARSYLRYVSSADVALRDVAYSMAERRSHHEDRLAVVAESSQELAENLQAFIDGESRVRMSSGHASSGQKPKLAFVLSGMGPQWWAMGRELLQTEPVFREAIERCDAALGKLAPWSLIEELTADEAHSRMDQTEIAQPANFALQVALTALLRSRGVEPDAIIGHSAGEVAASYIAGALSFEDAVTVIYHRSRLQQMAAGKGRMLAVGLPLAEAERELAGWGEKVSLAAVNGPASTAISGDLDALDAIARSLEERQIFARLVAGNVPYHSRHMDPLEAELHEVLAGITPRPAAVPLYSVVTGSRVEGSEVDASYWWRNVREPVRFAAAIGEMIDEGHTLFLELAPHPVLARDIASILSARQQQGTVLPTIRREEGERAVLLGSLGALYVQGFPLDWSSLNEPDARFVRLPGYAWQHERYWHESEAAREFRFGGNLHPLLGRRQESAHPTWQAELDGKALSYLEEHALLDTTLYPATGYLEMILAASKQMSGSEASVIEDLEIKRPLVLVDRASVSTQLVFDPQESQVSIFSRVRGASSWTLNLSARLLREPPSSEPPPFSAAEVTARSTGQMSGEECYREFELRGLQYGPQFQGIENVWLAGGEALARIHVPTALESDLSRYLFHPALLDCCLQVVHHLNQRRDGVYVPVRVDRVCFYRPTHARELWSYARLVKQGSTDMEADLCVADEAGVVAEFKGVRVQFLANGAAGLPEDIGDCLYEFGWYAKSRPGLVRTPADYLPAPSSLVAALQPEVARLSGQLERGKDYDIVDPQLDRLVSSYIVAALGALGWDLAQGQCLAADVLTGRLGVAPQFEQLFKRLLDILAEDGVLRYETGDWFVLETPAVIDAESLRQDILGLYPEHAPMLELLGRCGPKLAEVLRGEYPPLELVFPGGAMTAAEDVYQDSPGFLIYNLMVQAAVAEALSHLPPEKAVRILEVGAGTGGTTARLLPELPANRTEYVYTDVSSTFTTHAQQKFRDYPFVRYAILDLESDPVRQGFQPHSFDVVLAVDVLHATNDLRNVLHNVTRLLAPGGMLLLVEPTKKWRPFDLVFGLLGGWWRFEDHDLRPSHPLLPPETWKALLAEAGFPEVEAISDVSPASQALHTVFLARGPALDAGELRAEASMLLPTEPGSWLVYADSGGTGEALAGLLDGSGESCIIVRPGEQYALLDDTHCLVRPDSEEDAARLLGYVQSEWPTCRGVIHLWNLDAAGSESLAPEDRAAAQLRGTISVLSLVQALARADWSSPPALWLITRGGQAVRPGQAVSVLQSPVWGLGRVIMNEQPQLRCSLIDIDPDGRAHDAEFLFGELWGHDGEQEVAYRGAERYVNRLVRLGPGVMADDQETQIVEPGSIPYRLEATKPGILESLKLKELPRRTPEQGEVEIEVHATGLNFRDVMKAMGLYPQVMEDETGGWLGDECAGRVLRVGSGVSEFKPGDEVLAVAPGSFSAYLTVPTTYVVAKPATLSFEEAASTPIAFLTAHYALNHVARIQRGERVLIHAAAGGVGLAAVQLCQAAGAEIFATAGNPEKRKFLESLGIQHVMDDRTLDFAERVMEVTGGSGVDVVLNSLAGEFIPKSLSVLGMGGRFLELGKVDIYRNSHLALWPFRNGLSFSAIDLASLLRERPALVRQLLSEVMAKFTAGEIAPLPIKVFPIAEVADAFRFMSQARHTGKIVLALRSGPAPVATLPRKGPLFKADASYLISGGLGGFGLAVAEWMVDQGARHLVLLGRSGASTPEARDAVERLEKQGAHVLVGRVDVTHETELVALLAGLAQAGPPLRGIVHAAMVLDDGLLVSLDRERFERVMAPKVEGAWLLHQHTLGMPLDFFVNFSSFSAIAGVPGQANYSAANAFLDAMAHYRRALGLPALSINWGAIGEVGYVARHSDLYRMFERQGILPFKAREALAILERLMSTPLSQAGAARADFAKLASFYEQFAPASRMSHIIASEGQAHSESDANKGQRGWLRKALAGAGSAEREKLLEDFMREQLAEVLGISPSKLDIHQPLTSLGMDSLMAVQMETFIEVEAGVALPTGFLLSPEIAVAGVVQKVLAMSATGAPAAAGAVA